MDSEHQHQHQHQHLNGGYRVLQPNVQHPHQQHAAPQLVHPQPPHVQQQQPQQQHVQQHVQQHREQQQGYAPQNGMMDLSSLINDDYHHDLHRLQAVSHAPVYPHPFEGGHGQQQQHRLLQHDHQGSPHPPDQHLHGHQDHQHAQVQHQTHPSLRPFPLMHTPAAQHGAVGQVQQQDDAVGPQTLILTPGEQTPTGQGGGKRGGERRFGVVPNPPELEAWRQRLFDVNEMITLSEEEYYTYFPHVDNVYSHRSTQKYKRKPFVSHYWDCRLKGRPPGTPKSEDPAKKKRKRTARERDLCDVKIKITEYFEGAMLRPGFVMDGAEDGENKSNAQAQHTPQPGDGMQHMQMESRPQGPQQENSDPNEAAAIYNTYSTPQPPSHPQPHIHPSFQPPQPHAPSIRGSFSNPQHPHPGAGGARYFTIQRVNGNGGNGKGDGVAGPHKHSLADSDKVKRNSVVRALLKDAKELKRASGSSGGGAGALRRGSLAAQAAISASGPRRRATGEAAATVRRHGRTLPKEKEGSGVVFFGCCTDVGSQRVWIALEVLGVPYQYVESGVGAVPEVLAEVCPRGMVPAVRRGGWAVCGEGVVLEFLNESVERQGAGVVSAAGAGVPALGSAPKLGTAASRRASVRTASLSTPYSAEPVPASTALPSNNADAPIPYIPWAGATAPSSSSTFHSQPLSVSAILAPSTPAPPPSLLPPHPQDRAYARHWAAYVDATVWPAYTAHLRASSAPVSSSPAQLPASASPPRPPSASTQLPQGTAGVGSENAAAQAQAQAQAGSQAQQAEQAEQEEQAGSQALQDALSTLVGAAHPVGPFFGGAEVGWVDVVFAPVAVRLGRLRVGGGGGEEGGKGGRGNLVDNMVGEDVCGTRCEMWLRALEADRRVRATCCEMDAYGEFGGKGYPKPKPLGGTGEAGK